MPRFLLDTNIASHVMKGTYPSLDRHLSLVPKQDVAISVLVEAEIRFGLALLPRETKVHRLAERFLDQVEILVWDSNCAAAYGTLAAAQHSQGKPLSPVDTLIAAHAVALGATLVTNDQAFRFVKGLRIEDWTKGPRHV